MNQVPLAYESLNIIFKIYLLNLTYLFFCLHITTKYIEYIVHILFIVNFNGKKMKMLFK